MYVCCCNPFSDKAVKAHFEENAKDRRATVSELYNACSGGAKPQCKTCLPTLAEMVKDHNRKIIPIVPVPDTPDPV